MDEKDLPFEQRVQYFKYIIKDNSRKNILAPLIIIAAVMVVTVALHYLLPDVEAPGIITQIFVFAMACLGLKVAYGIYRYVKLKTDLILVKMQERDKKR